MVEGRDGMECSCFFSCGSYPQLEQVDYVLFILFRLPGCDFFPLLWVRQAYRTTTASWVDRSGKDERGRGLGRMDCGRVLCTS